MHRKYCCTEHQKQAWKDHKTICNVYHKLGLANNTDPGETAQILLEHADDMVYGRAKRLELALRVNIEVLAMTKHFGLTNQHFQCMMGMVSAQNKLEKLDEAEIFARDAVDFARTSYPDNENATMAVDLLVAVKLLASKPQEAIEVCEHFAELFDAEDSVQLNGLRLNKSKAFSVLGRHEEALAQLDFVRTSKRADGQCWDRLSKAQHNVGRLPEAIKSMEKAVALARVGEANIPAPFVQEGTTLMFNDLAVLYRQSGRLQDARRLEREAESLFAN
jgi:tetratricopeptide (TPR) repeat protein